MPGFCASDIDQHHMRLDKVQMEADAAPASSSTLVVTVPIRPTLACLSSSSLRLVSVVPELCEVVLQAEGAASRPFKLMQTFPGQYITFFILKQ